MKLLKVTHWKRCSGNLGSWAMTMYCDSMSVGWLVVCLIDVRSRQNAICCDHPWIYSCFQWKSVYKDTLLWFIEPLKIAELTTNPMYLNNGILRIVFVIIMFLFINENNESVSLRNYRIVFNIFVFVSFPTFSKSINWMMLWFPSKFCHEMP